VRNRLSDLEKQEKEISRAIEQMRAIIEAKLAQS
jgi:chaperonin cofactor prefoldin